VLIEAANLGVISELNRGDCRFRLRGGEEPQLGLTSLGLRSVDDGPAQVVSQRITGHEVTPFLLQCVQELSGGVSLTANIALIKHNALVGSHIAVALACSS
jgi:hypothetical protein